MDSEIKPEETAAGKETLDSQVKDLNSTRIESLVREESFKEDLQKKPAEISTLRVKLELAESEIGRLSAMLKDAEEERSSLSDKFTEKERELSGHIEMHEARQNEAMEKLEAAAKEITELSQMQKVAKEESTSNSLKISQIEDVLKQAENNTRKLEKETSLFLLDQKRKSEEQLRSKSQELSESLTREETLKKVLDEKTAEHKVITDTLYNAIYSIWNEKHKVEEELKNKTAKLGILEAKELMHSVTEIGKDSEDLLCRLHNAGRVIEIESSQEQMELLQSEKSQLEIEMERRKKELEDHKKELNSLFEKFPNIKVQPMLTITDELLSKKEEEVKVLRDKVASISVKVTAEVLSNMISGVDAFSREFEEGYGRLNSHVNEIANMIKMCEDGLIEMERKMTEKDEEVETLKEEKRQVIRQLCSNIEYYHELSKELDNELKEGRGGLLRLCYSFGDLS